MKSVINDLNINNFMHYRTPLFSVIAASDEWHASQEIDLMAIVIEIIGISDMPFLSAHFSPSRWLY